MENPAPMSFPMEKLELAKLKLYPKEYQFRRHQAQSGEVESHKINDTEWNPLLHGAPIYVHKRRDAKGEWEFAVVDGHHRVNFAQRLAAEGKLPADFKFDAYVLEEEKGINTETAKLMLAFKDIARGDGDVVDGALAIREAAEHPSVRQQFLPRLQMDKGNLALSVKILGLSKEAFKHVESGAVPVEAAAEVADRVKDPERQAKVMEIIGVKLKQDYPNYRPNAELAACCMPKANDNGKSWVQREDARAAGRSFVLGA